MIGPLLAYAAHQVCTLHVASIVGTQRRGPHDLVVRHGALAAKKCLRVAGPNPPWFYVTSGAEMRGKMRLATEILSRYFGSCVGVQPTGMRGHAEPPLKSVLQGNFLSDVSVLRHVTVCIPSGQAIFRLGCGKSGLGGKKQLIQESCVIWRERTALVDCLGRRTRLRVLLPFGGGGRLNEKERKK